MTPELTKYSDMIGDDQTDDACNDALIYAGEIQMTEWNLHVIGVKRRKTW